MHYKIHKEIHKENTIESFSYTDVLDNVIKKSPYGNISIKFVSLSKEEFEKLIIMLQKRYSFKNVISKSNLDSDTMFHRLEKDLFVFLHSSGYEYQKTFDIEVSDKTKDLKKKARKMI